MKPKSSSCWWNLRSLRYLIPGEIWLALKSRWNSGWGGSIRGEAGGSMAEYAILICGIALAILVLLQAVGSAINHVYLYLVEALTLS